jgi:hypothetical protein
MGAHAHVSVNQEHLTVKSGGSAVTYNNMIELGVLIRQFVPTVLGAALLILAADADAAVREQVLFEIPNTGHLRRVFLEGEGQAVGYSFEEREGKQELFLRGKWVEGYDSIPNASVVATPDGRHVAFIGIRGGREYAVLDGQEGPAFPKIRADRPDHHGPIQLSPDGKHICYVARMNDAPRKEEIIMDGDVVASPPSDIGRVSMSEDWSHWAYAARTTSGGWLLVMDGRERPDARQIGGDGIVFSPDGKRAAYSQAGIASIIDGNKVTPTGVVGNVVFSPDGKRFAIIARSAADETKYVMIDGVAGPKFKEAGSLIFSGDGKRAAYVARDGEKCIVICDGRAGPAFDGINDLQFSPKGDQLTYTAETALSKNRSFAAPIKREQIVLDAHGAAHSFPADSAAFDQDERHFACMANSDREFEVTAAKVFLDGRLVARIDGYPVMPIRFLGADRLLVVVERGHQLVRAEVSAGQ